MTLEELNRIRTQIALKSHDDLTGLAYMLVDELIGEVTRNVERDHSITMLAKEFQRICSERDALRDENARLNSALKKVAEQNQKKTRSLFGRSTEKTLDLLNALPNTDDVDEAEQDDQDTSKNSGEVVRFEDLKRKKRSGSKKKAGKKAEMLDDLPHKVRFIADFDELDRTYGEGNYRIAFWHKTITLEYKQPELYALETWTPSVSVGLEHELHNAVTQSKLIPKSLLSASLGKEIIYQKFCMFLPYYRLERHFTDIGFPLTRQTMSRWMIRIAHDYFYLLSDYMKDQLMQEGYHQVDETPLQVLHDGRRAGSKSFIWVHSSSELLDCHPIILFCYELTRGTDHLREFYKNFKGVITSDAYCSYQTLEKEQKGDIIATGCLMHARRRYADALSLIDISELSAEQVSDLPETKALILLGKIFDADGELKNLPLEERERRRDSEVRPIVKEYFNFIEGIDTSDPLISGQLKDAVNYSINQKNYLCRFLDDGNVPCDNGSSERHIRDLAIARRSFLFCNTIEGANALCVMFSVIETARANGADVRCYLQYVLNEMPAHMEDKTLNFIPSMMPWSDEYREYERRFKAGIPPDPNPNEYSTKPKIRSKEKEVA